MYHQPIQQEVLADGPAPEPETRAEPPAGGVLSRMRNAGLITKIALAAGLVGFLTILALTWYMYLASANILVERDTERLARDVDVAAARLSARMRFASQDALFFSRTAPAAGYFRSVEAGGVDPVEGSTATAWRERNATNLIALIETNPEYFQGRLIGAADGGREVVRVDRLPDGMIVKAAQAELQRKGGRPYFRDTLSLNANEVYLSSIDLNQEHGKIERPFRPAMRAATPIVLADGSKAGIFVINVDMARVFGLVRDSVGKDARLYIANQDGDFLYHPDPGKTFGFDLGQRYMMQREFPALAGFLKGKEDASTGIIDGPEGPLVAVATKVRFDPADEGRFVVIAAMEPVSGLEVGLSSVRNRALAAAGIALLVSLAAMAWLVRSFSRPLIEMSEMADAVAHGERELSLGKIADRSDEVGVLARSFETMVRQVKAREEALRETERVRRVIDVMPGALLIADRHGVIQRGNWQTQRMFGYSAEGLQGRKIETLIPERFRAGHPAKREGYVAAPKFRPMGQGQELFALHKDGHEFPVEVALAPLGEGWEGQVAVAVVDITERKAAADALQEANEKLIRTLKSNKELAQFAYVASHDLQEPLRMVDSYMGLIQRRYTGKLDTDADEFIAYAVDGARRMKQLINDLLGYSRISNRPFKVSEVDTNEVVEDVLDILDARLEEAGGEIEVGPMPTIPGDRGQLERLFTNLIGNAIKFHGEEPPRIRIGAEHEGSMWHFTIADNGIGIGEEFRKKVFEIFSRLHARSDYEGTGIGLAACKRIVEIHGGSIWVEDAPEGGSIFHFTLPDTQNEESD